MLEMQSSLSSFTLPLFSLLNILIPCLSPPRSSLDMLLESCDWRRLRTEFHICYLWWELTRTKYHRRDDDSVCVLSVISLTFSEGFCKAVVCLHWELCIATIAVTQACKWLEKHQLKNESFSLREISSSIHQDLGFLLDSKVCNIFSKFSIVPQAPVLIYWQGERKSCSVNSRICFMQPNT